PPRGDTDPRADAGEAAGGPVPDAPTPGRRPGGIPRPGRLGPGTAGVGEFRDPAGGRDAGPGPAAQGPYARPGEGAPGADADPRAAPAGPPGDDAAASRRAHRRRRHDEGPGRGRDGLTGRDRADADGRVGDGPADPAIRVSPV